jgi:hypothetical protein
LNLNTQIGFGELRLQAIPFPRELRNGLRFYPLRIEFRAALLWS